MKKRVYFSFFAIAASMLVFAAPVVEDEVRTAATKFVAADPVGSAVFKGRTVAGVRDADGLWIVSLSPSGHIIFRGSDLVEPIVGFSLTDFADPDPESPAFAMLDGARKTSLAAETSGAEWRHAKWVKLLEKKSRFSLLATDPVEPVSEAIIVPPFLQSHYNQNQPYNDYGPVCDSSASSPSMTGYFSYRGRSPCGCVATAAAQVFRHFRWPARIDQNMQCNHNFTDTNDITTTFPIRFNGHVPFDWSRFNDDYDDWIGGYDLRGSVLEAVRYPISRLVLWADVAAKMSFGPYSSNAGYSTVRSNVSDWYTPGTEVDVQRDYAQVKSDILAGVPCPISLTEYDSQGQPVLGHVVIAHGWAEDASSKYVYLNFGWGGSNDGYYNIEENFQDYQERIALVGHYPRAKPQLEPLPKVCGPNVTLNWDFPDFYNNDLSGFAVAVSKTATEPTTFLDDFSASDGVSTSDGIYVGVDGSYDYDGNLLYTDATKEGVFTYPRAVTLTSASVLTFKTLSFAALGAVYEVQASFDGGEWTTICTPSLKTDWGSSGWSTETLYLGNHGGAVVRFRIRNTRNSYSYYPSGSRILLDDFQVTNVLKQEEPTVYEVTAFERNFVLPRLENGAAYTFTVTPYVSSALVDGETSDPVSVVVAGNQRVPIPGVQSYHLEDLSFSTSDGSGVWAYAVGSSAPTISASSVEDWWSVTITAKLPGALTAESVLNFEWQAKNDYSKVIGTFSAVFIDSDGIENTLWSISNTSSVNQSQPVALQLEDYVGKTGVIVISFSFRSSDGYSYGKGMISSPRITNVYAPEVPSVAWDTVVRTDLGKPVIHSVSNVVDGVAVSPVREGFFRECKYGETTAFDVECSEYVENLNAYSSHLALVGERQITTRIIGPHTFRVFVDASGIDEEQSRSRLILTLEAIDANGTKAYKDLSLRFSAEGEAGFVEPLDVATSVLPPATSGVPYAVELEATGGVAPYIWSAATSFGYGEAHTANSFSSAVGEPRSQNNDEDSIAIQLPFDFPFYGSAYRNVYVNPNGALTFNRVLTDESSYDPTEATLRSTAMIAALWADYDRLSIYVDDTSTEVVTIHWSGMIYETVYPVSFSASLYADGSIRFCYGPENTYGGIIGVSSGNNADYVLSSMSESPGTGQDIVFTPQMPLPRGLELSPDGVLSGTLTASGVESVTVFVTDDAGTRAGRTFNLTIEQPVKPLAITTSDLPTATTGVWYEVTLEATGGVAPYRWSAMTLPDGLELSSDGTLSGTPTAPGNESVPIYVLDSGGRDTMAVLNLKIVSPLEITTSDLSTATTGVWYEVTLEATGGVPPYRWSAMTLPDGLELSSDGTLSGRPTASGTTRVPIYVLDSDGHDTTAILNLRIVQPLAITTSELPTATTGVWYEVRLEATGGVGPYEWSAPATMLPPGLSLSPEGILSGTPTESGDKRVPVSVFDSDGNYTMAILNLTIEQPPAPPVVSPSTDSVIDCESNTAAADLASRMNDDKAECFKAPEDAGLSGQTATDYANLFTASADGSSVVIELNETGTNTLETAATNVAAQVAADLSTIAATAEATAAVRVTGAQPGFYYSVVYDDDLRTLGSTEGPRALANDRGSVTLTIPKEADATACFYRVKVSVKAAD